MASAQGAKTQAKAGSQTGTPGLVEQGHPRVHWLNLIKLEETTAKHEP